MDSRHGSRWIHLIRASRFAAFFPPSAPANIASGDGCGGRHSDCEKHAISPTDLSRSSVADLHLLYFVVFVVLAFTVPLDTFDTLFIASSDVYLRLSDVGQLF